MINLKSILTLFEDKNDKVIVKEKQDDKKSKITPLQDKAPIKQVLQNSGEQLLNREIISIDAKRSPIITEGIIFTIVVK